MVHEGGALILIVDDESDLRALLDFNLRQAGHRVAHAGTGNQALQLARELAPSLVLLDLNLPDIPGAEVCLRLRLDAATRATPIVMLTARATEADRVVGLELGADDYVVKPFSVRELVLRVSAVLRRTADRPVLPDEGQRRVLRAESIEMDLDTHLARRAGQELQLTLLEFRLLFYLIEARGKVRKRDEILAHVWNLAPGQETRTVDTHVRRLREKLGEAGGLIETVRGVGYRFRST